MMLRIERAGPEDRDIAEVGVLTGILATLQQEGERWLARAVDAENKEALRRETERAWSLGIFGAPAFVVAGELFWGGDRMEDAFAWHRQGRNEHGTTG